jgi:long-chain acyl-CoA synthetase
MDEPASMTCAPPPILFEGAEWSSATLTRLALGWSDALRDELREDPSPIAMVMANHPEAVALFFALSSLPAPVILLPAESRGWRTAPPLPAGTRLALAPTQRRLGTAAERLGLHVVALPAQPDPAGATDAAFMTAPAVVLFTSGSTDLPKPVCRPMRHLLAAAAAVATAAEFPDLGGIIGTLPLSRIFGLHHCLLAAALLGRPLALLPAFHHRAVLALFASGRYHYWAGTPFMADFLGRSLPSGTHPAPRRCMISGRLSTPVCETFEARFGVPLRQVYGTTETGPITVDSGPLARVRSETAGMPLAGVGIVVGEDPNRPFPAGILGRIWARTPWCMDGYGFPCRLEPRQTVNGWWPTPDAGYLDEDGYLMVAGRLDDCIRTAAGHLVNPAEVAAAVERYRGVTDAAVVPLGDATAPVLAVLVEGEPALSVDGLRHHLATALPPWSLPRVVEPINNLPRLPGGKVDRLACIALLELALSRGQDG